MRIIQATRDRVPEIVDLRRRAFLHQAPRHYTPREVENLLSDYSVAELDGMVSDRRLFAALNGMRLLGCCGWHAGHIRHLYVDPDSFRSGIGSRLLDHAIADYVARTRSPVVDVGSIVYARRFYESNGFHVVLEKRAWDGSRYFLMRRRLPTSRDRVE